MEAARQPPGEINVLRRLIRYAEQLYGLHDRLLAAVGDTRAKPRIPASVVVQSALLLFWARLGSLNEEGTAAWMCRAAVWWWSRSTCSEACPLRWTCCLGICCEVANSAQHSANPRKGRTLIV